MDKHDHCQKYTKLLIHKNTPHFAAMDEMRSVVSEAGIKGRDK